MWDITACRLGNFYRHFYGMRHPSSSGSSSLTYPKTQIFINTATVTSNIAQESSSFLCDKKKKIRYFVMQVSLSPDQGRREGTRTRGKIFSVPPASADGLQNLYSKSEKWLSVAEWFWAWSKEVVLYCTVVGSRRLTPPNALQPKAYCTNPGLLLVPTCTARCLHQGP